MVRRLAVLVVVAACSASEVPVDERGLTVLSDVHHDVSPPLRELAPGSIVTSSAHPARALPRPARSGVENAPVQDQPVLMLAPTLSRNFLGLGNGFSGPQGSFSVSSAPPDPAGDVGPNHYVQVVNSSFAVFSKTGTVLHGPVATSVLWSGFGGGCETNNDGDAVVLYDPIADRWLISQFSVSTTPYLQCVAVSTTPDPTGTWNRYSFSYGNTEFPDYPKLGVWPDAYYATFNIFDNGQTFGGAKICAYDRAKMLAGQPATQICFPNTSTSFGGLLPSDLDGSTQPPAGSPNYIVGLGDTSTTLAYWKAHVDFATPANSTLTGPTRITVPAYTEPSTGVPQPATSGQLDTLGDRLMYRLAYRNFGDHEALVANHTVTAGSSMAPRWYELRVGQSNSLSLFQSGTFAPDSTFRWMGSIAMDQSGNIALGYSAGSSSLKPEINYTGRLVGDAAGTMGQGEATIMSGLGSQTGSLTRWGDYTMMTVDPADDCTFFYTNEYLPADGSFNWATRIASFKFPSCGSSSDDFSIAVAPATISAVAGTSTSTTVTTAVTAGAAVTVSFSISGLPAGATASFSPNAVTSGGSSVLTITAGPATSPGTYDLSVVGTSTSVTHATPLQLVVTAPIANDFSLDASPATVGVVEGASANVTLTTAVTSGNPETIALSASGLPTGATVAFSTVSVTAGSSSVMTLTAGAATPPGSYSVTVTGTAPSATHAVTITVTVSAPVIDDFSMTVSPNSVSVAQGAVATATISTAVTSGNAQAIALGVTGLPAGATASFTPASVTAGLDATLTIATTSSTPPGTYSVSIVGTGTTLSHATALELVVVPDDFAIAASPSSVSVLQGGSAQTTISTALISGDAQLVVLSASGLPAGASAVFSPASVSVGGSATLTLTAGSATPGGTYAVTVTGTGTSATHSTTVSFAVTATGVVNGGFETGTFAGWSIAGTTAIVTGSHTGRYAAALGRTSSITQTFTTPINATTLTFWFRMTCRSLSHDWATATVRDNTTGTTTTILPATCSRDTAWHNVAAPVAAGHSVTLTVTSHDGMGGGPGFQVGVDDVAATP